MLGTLLAEKYELKEKIGQGHLGIVYKAHCADTDEVFAVKVLTQEFSKNERAIQRFKREARAASELTHPNIVRVHDFGDTADGSYYIVMELIEGTTLRRLIRRVGPLPMDRCKPIFGQILDALQHSHEVGLVHRDLKPGNIILVNMGRPGETAKLVDFGLARHVDATKAAEEKVTLDGYVAGTPAYMSPEQCLGGDVDPRSDVYSLGCVLFRATTGMAPVPGITPQETMTNQVRKIPVPFDKVPSSVTVSDELKNVIMKALEKRPEDRYQSAIEMKEALSRVPS